MDFILEYYFDFGLMGDEFGRMLDGFFITVKLSVYGGILALAWGLVLAVLRQLPGRPLAPVRWVSIAYIDIFRGIPMLLILLLVSSSLSAFAGEGLIPRWLGNPTWLGENSAFWWGVMSLTLTYGAYMAEVYRAGIEAVPAGQMEAARSLGMSHAGAMRHVIVPQAVRKVIRTAAQRLHRADEGHVAGQHPRRCWRFSRSPETSRRRPTTAPPTCSVRSSTSPSRSRLRATSIT